MAAHLIRRGFLGLLALCLMTACASAPAPAAPGDTSADAAAVVRLFLVRHGEKETGTDPALTPEGAARARALAERLKDEGVTEVW